MTHAAMAISMSGSAGYVAAGGVALLIVLQVVMMLMRAQERRAAEKSELAHEAEQQADAAKMDMLLNEIRSIRVGIESLTRRLDVHDAEIKEARERDHRIENSLLREIEAMKRKVDRVCDLMESRHGEKVSKPA